MSQTFITRIKDPVKHRIVIEKKAWDEEGLKEDDWIKVTIEKVEK